MKSPNILTKQGQIPSVYTASYSIGTGGSSPGVKLMECKDVCAQDNFYDHKNKHGGYNGKRHLAQGPKLIAIIF
jgi:hypothetical protein